MLPLSLTITYLSWFIDFPVDTIRAVGGRLRLSSWLVDTIIAAVHLGQRFEEIAQYSPGKAVQVFDQQPHLSLMVSYLLGKNQAVKDKIASYFADWQFIQPQTTGDDLRARGIPPGPHYRQILDALRTAWLNGEIDQVQEEQALLEKLIDEFASNG